MKTTFPSDQTKGLRVENRRGFIGVEASLPQQSAKQFITNQEDASVLSACVDKVVFICPRKEAEIIGLPGHFSFF